MPIRKITFQRGQYYHIYNRGAGKNSIYLSEANYEYFKSMLLKHCVDDEVGLVCYCLMPNHFHLVLVQDGKYTISRFIQGLCSAYTQAFNEYHGRCGTLFEGRFKSVLVDRQEYLLHLMRYVHINPVKAGLMRKPERWEHSDYRLWTVKGQGNFREVNRIIRFRQELGIPGADDYKTFVEDFLKARETDRQFWALGID